MDIAIYGGSFNPPHLGHREAVITALETLSPDLFLIIPDREPPHKEMEEGSPSPEQRLELCRLTFGDLDRVEVSPMELERSGKSYTYDTVCDLEKLYPGAKLTLILGTDMLESFEEWYHFEYLLEHCRIAALARDPEDDAALRETAKRFREQYGAEIALLDHAPLPISSTDLREMLRRRLGAEEIHPDAYASIIQNRYYEAAPELSWLREQAYTMLDERRIAHVAGCEGEAIELARRWGEDPETAAEAGILHDITKRLSHEEQLKLCEKYGIMCDNAERHTPKLLHAKTGAAAARERFGIPDAVYEAIRWHTTGKPDMTLLEKIIYLADYIEPSRDFPGVEELRELAYEDLDRALLLGLRMTVEEVRSHSEEPYIDTLTACTWYEERISERRD
ncbi:MAG: bis(5'-nucleosyl)-tetraphosphatase (symmetrical) YqeK [Oscillospiraceae bacterium]|nr:bis(5'-nucleosyl)-tetraphosphatase (symmetrical) YqeK [Oscillospiraceae bacterium]